MNAKKCGCEESEGLWYLCPMHDKQARIAWKKNKEKEDCPACDGKGWMHSTEGVGDYCHTCNGTGKPTNEIKKCSLNENG